MDGQNGTVEAGFGWGIWSTGVIANRFAEELDHVAGARRAAVCSRSLANAETFAAKHGCDRAYDDADAFLADDRIDAVYIASPHIAHCDQALKAIAAGKAVLIEKPVAMNAAEARAIDAAARQAGVFVMEALWTRFLPAVQRARELVEAGALGAVQRAEASTRYHRPFDAAHRLFDPALGGGVLLDLGVYPLSVASFLLGEPKLSEARWIAGPTGVDVEAQLSVDFGGVPASIHAGFMPEAHQEGDNCLVLYGDKGTLRIDRHFMKAASLTLWERPLDTVPSSRGLGERIARRLPMPGRKRMDFPRPSAGLNFQVAAVQAAVRRGETSHPVMPMADSIAVLGVIEQALATTPVSTRD